MDPQASRLLDKSIQAYQQAIDLKPETKQYGAPIEELTRISLANAYKVKGIINASSGDSPAAIKATEEAISILRQTVGTLEQSVTQHESYRRYLAQNYEYLGEAYQWLGYTHELTADYPNALAAYQKSMDSFDLCIKQGKNTPDLIITNDIIGLRCEPYLQDVKNSFNNINGGQ
jgi:tetratricopeptide (TPR) repeat protein